MKTILYNPIFINPQAYYVFPQLYNIEKGDSFIEPAIYSGYLLIEDLISNTSSQVTDTREVDFTQFAGRRIRISQYTNIGAVVLGEWLLPEGEQSGPSFHQSLVDAWFMSGPSNSDKPSSITGVMGNEMILKNFAFTSESGFGEGNYEGALVFDGVDDYGICNNLPILNDYTVICRREIINKESGAIASKRTSSSQWDGAFIFERNNQLTSFGQNNYRTIQQNNVSYMTTTSYNGGTISRGSLQDTEYLVLGAAGFNIDLNRAHEFSNCAIYYFALYNKSLTPEEIETEKERLNEEWLKRSKVTIPEPDVYYDLSLKDNSSPTRNIIDDLSGNEHDAEIFNAAYTESSGYRSDGAFVFDSIDDYAIMQNVTKGFKTLFMEVIPSLTTDKSGFLYDQRVGQTSFGISISLNHMAYNAYNWGGVTYINGKLNTTMNGKEVYLKHQIITIVNGTDLKPQKVVLGGDIGLAGYFSNMALYKLIGFYDELTPLQIEKVINDYKLKYD